MKKPIHLMTKYILSFLFSLITIFSFGQEKVTITGKVTDVLNFPLTDSEVILGNKADSTKISTTSTNDDGTFKIEINLQNKLSFFCLSYYQHTTKKFFVIFLMGFC